MVDLLGFVMRHNHCSPRIALANCGPVLILLCTCKLLINLNLYELEITQSKSSAFQPQSKGALERWHQTLNENLLL